MTNDPRNTESRLGKEALRQVGVGILAGVATFGTALALLYVLAGLVGAG